MAGGGRQSGQIRGAYRARRQQRSDIVWGSVLALGLPLVSFLIASVANPGGLEEKFVGGSFSEQEETPAPPMSPELAEAILREIKRLYEVNYQQIFLPRFNREDLEFRERFREFEIAKYIVGYCKGTLLARLKEALADPDSQIQSLSGTVENWDRVLSEAARSVEDMDPRPAALRPSAAGSATE
jgi:hypothetical protein